MDEPPPAMSGVVHGLNPPALTTVPWPMPIRAMLVLSMVAACAHPARSRAHGASVPEAEPEPEHLVMKQPGMVSVTIPNPFVRLGPCPEHTTRVDERRRGAGELSCRLPDGVRHGPYARNTMGAPVRRYAFIGKAERGQYERGIRVGVWHVLQWGPGMIPHVHEVVYADGEPRSRRIVEVDGGTCRKRCDDEARKCQARQDACPPGAPCLFRDCRGRRMHCHLNCQAVKHPVW